MISFVCRDCRMPFADLEVFLRHCERAHGRTPSAPTTAPADMDGAARVRAWRERQNAKGDDFRERERLRVRAYRARQGGGQIHATPVRKRDWSKYREDAATGGGRQFREPWEEAG